MRRCSTPSLLPLSFLLGALLSGCVTQGTYDTVSQERDALRRQKQQLETDLAKLRASTTSFQGERVSLIDDMEDLRVANEAFEKEVGRLRRAETELSVNLAARESELGKLRGTYDGLVADLEDEVASGQIEIEQLREGLRLNLAQEILFPSGSDRLDPRGVAVLHKVAARLKSLPNQVEVQGHTDNVALRDSPRFASNWELAAARSGQVVRLMMARGVDPKRLTVVSFGEHAPIASNDTREGRAKNRRIEIRLLPAEESAAAESPDPS
jgi:chemotaxis protein MotB